MKRFRTALLKHVFPIAYLALVFAACALRLPLAVPFFSFFAPVVAVCGLFLIPIVALSAVIKYFAPDYFKAQTAKAAAELRSQSLISRIYSWAHTLTLLGLLIGSYHPFYAVCNILCAASASLFRRLLADV